MTRLERWQKWAANPGAMSAADQARFRKEWKARVENKGKPLTAEEEKLGAIICQFLARTEAGQLEAQQWAEENWAREQVKPWPEKIAPEDYDFRDWAKEAQLLAAGCMYEYARESHKLRCLLALMHRRTHQGDELGVWFGELTPHEAEATLGDWLYFLEDLAPELAANRSFAWVRANASERLAQALEDMRRARLADDNEEKLWRGHFMASDGIDFGFALHADRATCFETVDDAGARAIDSDGRETVLLRIRWNNFTNTELGRAMERFAKEHRPPECEAATHDGPDVPRSWSRRLRDLGAMRLLATLPEIKAQKAFQAMGGNASDLREKKADSENFFKVNFPFEAKAAHAVPWTTAQRAMRKSMGKTPE